MWNNARLMSLKDMKFGFVDSMHDTQSSLDSAKVKEEKLNSEIDNYLKTNENENNDTDNSNIGKSDYEKMLEEHEEYMMQLVDDYDKTQDDIEKIDKQIQDAEKAEEQKKAKEQNPEDSFPKSFFKSMEG